MDSFSLGAVLKILADFGIVGLVIFLWWSDNKRIWEVIEKHSKDTQSIMDRYQRDMEEQREMYRANASLCRDFSSIAGDLRDIVTLNIQKMTEVDNAVRQNQFCPLIRVDKKKIMQMADFMKDGQ